ncbi:hypothetical protein AwWohl_02020 [Gammaproteobacteria bacterium]|nr:hypothetical protein AwWohl_02020 [Gammaproteobacteria bacterium]
MPQNAMNYQNLMLIYFVMKTHENDKSASVKGEYICQYLVNYAKYCKQSKNKQGKCYHNRLYSIK